MRRYMRCREYACHLARIQGNFHLVADTQDAKIVGLIGRVRYSELSPIHKAHIAHFYGLYGHRLEYLSDYPALTNRSNYTGFIKIYKGE